MSSESSPEPDLLLDCVPGNLDEIDRLLAWIERLEERCPQIGKRLKPLLHLDDLPAELHPSRFEKIQQELVELDFLLLDAWKGRQRCVSKEIRRQVAPWLIGLTRARKELLKQLGKQTVDSEVEDAITRFASLLDECLPDLEDLATLLITAKAMREKHQEPAGMTKVTPAQAPPVLAGQTPENSIKLVGEYWDIRYGHNNGLFAQRSNTILPQLRKLLSSPNRSPTVAELLGDPEGTLAADAQLRGECTTDPEGIQFIRRRLQEIAEIRKETGGSQALDDEEAELTSGMKKAGRHLESQLRKAHHNLATQLRKFCGKLAESMPQLHAHLKEALRLDFPHFGYFPPPGTPAWEI
jgi:hypothetical protein